VPANRFRDRLTPASANGRIGDARDEWLKEPARMADAEAVDESRQTHQFTIWNCAGFRLKEDINQPYHGVWEQIPKRKARTTVAVRIGDCLRWTCSCLAGIVVRKKRFSRPSLRTRAEKRFHSSVLRSPTCSRSVAWCSTSRHLAATNSRKWHGLSLVRVASGVQA